MLSFGTSGLRGLFGKEITPSLIFQIANRFADGKIVGLGRDCRPSSLLLSRAAMLGIAGKGSSVFDAGIVPTPTLAGAYKRAVMITASHNPPEYNGIKLFEDGIELSREDSNVYLKGHIIEDKIGEIVENHDEAVDKHVDAILNMFSIEVNEKIVVDCNGSSYVIVPKLMESLNARLISVNCSGFMNRPSEPSEGNLNHLLNSSIAFANDGDGDRVALIYKKKYIKGDKLLGALASFVLKKNDLFVTTIETSLGVLEFLKDSGINVEITKVGSTYVGKLMKQREAKFGGEPAGEFIFANISYVPDGIASIPAILSMHKEKILDDALNSIKTYFIERRKYKVNDKEKVMSYILSMIDIEGKRFLDDGIRVDGDDYWVLIRPSGTEPLIRLTVEAKEKTLLKALIEKGERLIKEGIRHGL